MLSSPLLPPLVQPSRSALSSSPPFSPARPSRPLARPVCPRLAAAPCSSASGAFAAACCWSRWTQAPAWAEGHLSSARKAPPLGPSLSTKRQLLHCASRSSRSLHLKRRCAARRAARGNWRGARDCTRARLIAAMPAKGVPLDPDVAPDLAGAKSFQESLSSGFLVSLANGVRRAAISQTRSRPTGGSRSPLYYQRLCPP